jgi:hypothetical protein
MLPALSVLCTRGSWVHTRPLQTVKLAIEKDLFYLVKVSGVLARHSMLLLRYLLLRYHPSSDSLFDEQLDSEISVGSSGIGHVVLHSR